MDGILENNTTALLDTAVLRHSSHCYLIEMYPISQIESELLYTSSLQNLEIDLSNTTIGFEYLRDHLITSIIYEYHIGHSHLSYTIAAEVFVYVSKTNPFMHI